MMSSSKRDWQLFYDQPDIPAISMGANTVSPEKEPAEMTRVIPNKENKLGATTGDVS